MKTLIALFALVALAPSALAQEARLGRLVSVAGSCTREVTTDRGSITLTAVAKDTVLKEAVSKATRAYERTLEAVKRLNLENSDIKTVEYSVNEDREWIKDRYVNKGYVARMGIKVSTSDVKSLGEVTAIASREDLSEVGGLVSYLSPEKLLKEQTACLKDAAEHAREKAEKLATTLNAHLGEVVEINEGNVSEPPRPRPLMAMAHAAMREEDAAPAPSIQSGNEEVSATVQVTFALK